MCNLATYGALIGNLIQFTRWLSITSATFIRVNTICLSGIFRYKPESFITKFDLRTPMVWMAKMGNY